ncbi:phage tail protein, partial [Enterococcus faecalis]|nr:phage tail protein [Enterococcus faecalis]
NNREQAIADYVNSKKRFYGFDKGFVFWGDQAVEELNNIRDKTTYKYFVESNHPEFDPFHRPKFLQDIIDILNSMNDDKTHVLEGQLTKLKEAINE